MTLEIALDVDEEWDSSSSWHELARSAAEAAIEESAFAHFNKVKTPIEISVTLTSDDEVRELNHQWRGKEKATNVLSFPMLAIDELDGANVLLPQTLLGDIILARGICGAEAAQKEISLRDHAAHLLVHGTLHLLGYDHEREKDALDMEAREIRALARMGIANPYEVTV